MCHLKPHTFLTIFLLVISTVTYVVSPNPSHDKASKYSSENYCRTSLKSVTVSDFKKFSKNENCIFLNKER